VASPIEHSLADLRQQLRHDPRLAERVTAEVADHLLEVAANEGNRGMTDHDAEQEAVRRFGDAAPLARQYRRSVSPLWNTLLSACAVSTTLIVAWLLSVLTTIMPVRDPAHIPLWVAITFGFAVFDALTVAVVLRGPRPPLVRMLSVLALGALAFGGVAIRAMYVATTTGAHFEGYQLLMGLAIAGHGACVLAYAVAQSRDSGSHTTTA
jgi:hypothetical protein